MTSPLLPAPVLLRESRDRTIAALTDAFARDTLAIDVLEARLSQAHAAESLEQLAALTADLPAWSGPTPAPAHALIPAHAARPADTVLTILGSTERRGTWIAPRTLAVRSILGSTVLDFRHAQLPVGVVDVVVSAILGSIEVVVPPGLAVEVHGSGILGSFESMSRAPGTPDPERPVLRVRGVALLGSVEVRTEVGDVDPRS